MSPTLSSAAFAHQSAIPTKHTCEGADISPPLALRGCKEMITYARDHTVADGLNYVATWNAAMLLSTDLDEALAAGREKRAAKFRD